jgi:hypothetical protein
MIPKGHKRKDAAQHRQAATKDDTLRHLVERPKDAFGRAEAPKDEDRQIEHAVVSSSSRQIPPPCASDVYICAVTRHLSQRMNSSLFRDIDIPNKDNDNASPGRTTRRWQKFHNKRRTTVDTQPDSHYQ